MASVADRIVEAQDREATYRRSIEINIRLYTDNSHFIYELLQNAEDTEANHIKFVQFEDRLEVYHDGRPFTFENLQGLCDVGRSDKEGNLNKIGKFGVGFKSVFSICETVKLVSNPDNYRENASDALDAFAVEIVNFTTPRDIEQDTLDTCYTTKFVFPYAVGHSFSGFKTELELRRKISSKLMTLGVSTLLFMKHLEVISYEINLIGLNTSGEYVLEKEPINDHCQLISALGRKCTAEQGLDDEISYLKFSRSVDANSPRTVDIAFPVVRTGDESFECKNSDFAPFVFVYFPTEMESKLGFIVQGPYKTTPTRNSIPSDDADNIYLASETARLLVETLKELRNKGWLNMSFIKALPLNKHAFDNNDLFSSLYDKVKELLSNAAVPILPCHSGDYVAARYAKIVRNTKLLDLFSDELLTDLVHQYTIYHWLPTCLTETNKEYAPIRSYLINELGVEEIRPEDLKRFFAANPSFLSERDNDWLIKLYNLLSNIHKEFDRNSDKPNCLTAEIIKTSQGDFVAAYRKTESKTFIPNVFLPSSEILSADIPYVDSYIYSQCKYFFNDVLRLRKPNEYEFFISDVRKRYNDDYVFDEDRHIDDVKKLIKYSGNSNYQEEVQNIIKDIFLIRCTDGNMRNPHTPGIQVFLPENKSIDIAGYLEHIAPPNVYFVDLELYARHQIGQSVLEEFGVIGSLLSGEDIISGELESEGKRRKRKWHTSLSFRWKLNMIHLSAALKYIDKNPGKQNSVVKSQVIFSVLSQNEEKLSGTVYDRNDNVLMSGESCDLVKILRGDKETKRRWVYDEAGNLVTPREITKEEINQKYYGELGIRAVVYELLEFKKSPDDVVRDLKSKIPSEQLEKYFEAEIRKRYKMSSKALMEKLNSLAGTETPQGEEEIIKFPTARVKNWDALRKHVHEVMSYGAPAVFKCVQRHIRVSRDDESARNYLKSQYGYDNHPQFACQMCHKSSPNIEASQLFKNPEMELAQLYLSLCPHCAKNYRSLRDSTQEAPMKQFKRSILHLSQQDIDEANPVCLKLRNYDIWFTQTHVAEIRELLQLEQASKT